MFVFVSSTPYTFLADAPLTSSVLALVLNLYFACVLRCFAFAWDNPYGFVLVVRLYFRPRADITSSRPNHKLVVHVVQPNNFKI